jgi:hypothetical protein
MVFRRLMNEEQRRTNRESSCLPSLLVLFAIAAFLFWIVSSLSWLLLTFVLLFVGPPLGIDYSELDWIEIAGVIVSFFISCLLIILWPVLWRKAASRLENTNNGWMLAAVCFMSFLQVPLFMFILKILRGTL